MQIIEHADMIDDEVVEEIKSEDTLFEIIRDEYVALSISSAILNIKSSTAMFYSLMGGVLHDKGIKIQQATRTDTRIHVLHFQPSRTGKQIALDFMCYMAERMGITTVQEVSITDAGLTGQFDGTIDKSQRASNIVPDDPRWIDPVTPGDFFLYGFVTFPEAKQMFKPDSKYNKDLLELIQMVTDNNAYIHKRTGPGVVEYKSPSTIVGTSYVLDEFRQMVSKQGIFQRFFIGHDLFPPKKRRLIARAMNLSGIVTEEDKERFEEHPEEFNFRASDLPDKVQEEIGHDIINYEDIYPRANELAKKIVECVNAYDDGYIFYKTEQAGAKLDSYENQRYRIVEAEFVGPQVEIIHSFLTSFTVLHHKLAAVSAVLNGHKFIEEIDVQSTSKAIDWCYHSVVYDILSRVVGAREDSIQKLMTSLVVESGTKGLNKRELIDTVMKRYHFEGAKIKRILKNLVDTNVLTQSGGTIKFVKR